MNYNIRFFQMLWFISTGTFLWRKKCSFRELHFSEGTSYKIHTLGEREDYWSRSTLNMKGVFQSPALIYLYAGLGSRWTAIHNDWCHRSPSTIYTQGRRNSRVRGAIVIPPPLLWQIWEQFPWELDPFSYLLLMWPPKKIFRPSTVSDAYLAVVYIGVHRW